MKIEGYEVSLTLSSKVGFGDLVTVTYTQPEILQIQSLSGIKFESLENQEVSNLVKKPIENSDWSFNLYPNPNNGNFSIDNISAPMKYRKIEIYIVNLFWQIISAESFTIDTENIEENTYDLNLYDLFDGLYIAIVKANNRTVASKKFIKVL